MRAATAESGQEVRPQADANTERRLASERNTQLLNRPKDRQGKVQIEHPSKKIRRVLNVKFGIQSPRRFTAASRKSNIRTMESQRDSRCRAARAAVLG